MIVDLKIEPSDAFHAHLDACKQCREHPFGLCSKGAALMRNAVDVVAEQRATGRKVPGIGGAK